MNSKVQFRMFTIFDLDKVEEYLHEMHLKGWKYKANRFDFFYFEQCQPDDVIYRVWNTSYLRKNELDLQGIKDRDWEFVEGCSYSVFRKAKCDLVPNEQIFMNNRLRWDGAKSGLRTATVSISGGLVVCMSLFRESLSQSFFLIFALYALMISYLIYSFYRLRRKYLVD
ncbi:DUF2812 domain-containing protein [Streptococcus sp. HMSC061D10]|uniref:DUF2812 domain-containing protein n=1 Tax=Streptococcus sp. HMSC061D10 TaxID=1715207 RepID=UPI0008ABE65E|nr:DUF2812 domain-containing protein [Streptococcus sp. HMSC061D10]OFN80706.1 phosphoglycerate kinase [Streptococcus sp. HMSC061D10]